MEKGFKNKKVLVMGLGVLGGGIATTKWLVKQGASVTVTDLRSREQLKSSIKQLGIVAKKIKLVLGEHREADFKTNDIIVVNPAVPRESKYLAIAKKHGARLENEASLFFRYSRNPIIAVTGTRGKTTTVNWILFLLKQKFLNAKLTGNSSDQPMLGILDSLDGKTPVIAELSSWHLELLNQSGRAPEITLITNIYPDHLNRYSSVKDYASAKANIFKNQKKGGFLILNKKNEWTKFFMKKFSGWKTRSKVLYFPAKTGINEDKFADAYGRHNLENFQAAFLAAKLAGIPESAMCRVAWHLPQIKFRQEMIIKSPKLTVVNDTTATSPDGTMAALRRFGKENIILIAGGTDKNLEYAPPAGGWARAVKRFVRPERLYLLNGSATEKMIAALKKIGYFKNKKINLYENLGGILKYTSRLIRENKKTKWMVVFSPGAASFEKFRNEFDRGEQFSRLAKKVFSRYP